MTLLTIVCVFVVLGAERAMLDPHAGRRAGGGGDGGARAELKEDKKHMSEHHHEETYFNESDITENELALYYFKLHDLNNDTKLDGLEIYKALEHSDLPAERNQTKQKHLPPVEHDAFIADIIDEILADEDLNNDGYIDLAEFMKMQSSDEADAT